jgi:hypothetical protein
MMLWVNGREKVFSLEKHYDMRLYVPVTEILYPVRKRMPKSLFKIGIHLIKYA